ncbi:cobalamin B12-binding domain-containing protein [Streptomyces flavofungini]|uniref:Cobalamin-dependent protein n=1 Tax=Streptomyces flavofungini TaxID=68200 RepID=A0ABS0X6Y2_9ACTN|nr:cobalamin-dependent protein [Streptomyces flavofungini]MBJ3808964.1 cobalamin-dependent protein [Streptomyces flavofungini]GHC67886.1 cobalamin-binding protein [Streptomyces flavofungini]
MTPTATAPDGRAAPWAAALWHAVVAGDESTAADTGLAALEDGLDAECVLLDVIGAVQRRVGEEWAVNKLTVAQEHAATAINERVIAALSRPPGGTPPTPRPDAPPGARVRPGTQALSGSRAPSGTLGPSRITVACVDGEWHALPARLLAEVLALRGWRVDFLGAQVPTAHLIAHLRHTGADAVALSGSLVTRLPTAHAAISACRAAGVPVLAGGAAFGPGGRHAELLGADLWAGDARTAAARLTEGPPRRPVGPPFADEPLKHLLDQEYTLVSRSAPQLVRATLNGLRARFPALLDYTESQQQHTAEDVSQIVAFLGAALYVDDSGLFASFGRWTAAVLAARHVPVESLLHALDLLSAEVRDFPRAAAMIREGHEAVRTWQGGTGE